MMARDTVRAGVLVCIGASFANAGEDQSPRFSADLSIDYTTAYYFRGIIQEDDGLIIQPAAEIGLRLHEWDSGSASFVAGIWNSIHGDTDTAAPGSSTPNWYEADLYLGAAVELGNVSLGATYTWYTSPSDAFDTIEELSFTAAYDDSDCGWLWGAGLSPHATVAFELGDDAADGGNTGVYLELGVEPAIAFDEGTLEGASVSFPVTLGLSLDDYYESGTDSDVFGYVDAGAVFLMPIPLDESWGAWALSAGVHVLFLGDAASDINGGDDVEIIGTLGVSASF